MKRHILFYSVLILALFISSSFGQRKRNCYTMDVLERLEKENPGLTDQMQQIEVDLQQRIIDRLDKFGDNSIQSLRTVQVVVHVLYNNSSQNISDSQVRSQIDVLNQDFQKMQNTPGYNTHPAGANTQINFALASVDPSGNPSSGITRTSTSKNSFGMNDDIKKSSRGGKDAWPTDQYLNIWVGKLSNDILGYAQFPGGPASTDGVVVTYDAFGTNGTALYPFDMGRTTTHEVGHYFNLYHIWGDGGCGVDDLVNDTPESDDANYGCAQGHVSCGSVDMVENYMDYSDDACMNIYTVGQSNRMNGILDGIRSGLLDGGTPPSNSAPVANANGPYTGTSGSEIQFSSSGSNDPDGTIASYLWNFGDGYTSSAANPAHTYNTAGTYQVSLKVTDNEGASTTAYTSAEITEVPSNVPPVADAGGPYNARLGETVNFRGDGSVDSDGSIVSYLWDFGDGYSSTSKNPSHTYNTLGTFQISLLVTDDDGYSDQDFTTAEITQAGSEPEVVFEEGFEFVGSEVPGENWRAFDRRSRSGRDYWGDQHEWWGAKVHTGEWSMYCAEWSNLDGATYDNYMNAFAIYNNWINVSQYTQVEFSFWMWFETNNSKDYILLEVREKGSGWTKIAKWSGREGNYWQQYSFRLAGYTKMKFRFRFISNGSGRGDGAYIDDIVISGLNDGKSPSISSADNLLAAIPILGRTFDYESFAKGDQKSDIRSTERDVEVDSTETIARETALLSNYPNPFNPSTTINVSLPVAGEYTLKVYNTIGQEVANLYSGRLESGSHTFNFDASKLSSGMYIYSVRGGDVNISKKMILLR